MPSCQQTDVHMFGRCLRHRTKSGVVAALFALVAALSLVLAAVVWHVAHRVAVLYRGRIVESGPTEQVCEDPRHSCAQALLAAAPVPDPAEQRKRRERRTELVERHHLATKPLVPTSCLPPLTAIPPKQP